MPQARGVRGIVAAQYESIYGTDPGTPDLTKIPIESEGFKSDQNQIASGVLSGNRNPTKPIAGNINVAGPISTELGAYPGLLFVAAAGSVKTEANSGSGEVTGSALAAPTGTIDDDLQTLAIAQTTHGLAVGDVLLVAGITAPTDLNDTYIRVMSVTDTDNFVCRLPLGISGTFTPGAGTISKVTTPATTYKHTMNFGGKLPSLVVEKGFQDVNQFFKYNGCVVSSLSLSGTPEGFQKINFDFMGQKETVGTSSFDATATDLGKASFSGFGLGTIEEGGAAIANVTKVDISIDNSLDGGQYVMGSAGLRSSLPEGMAKVSGTIDALFENTVLYNKAVNSTESSIKLIYSLGNGDGTAGNESFEIFIPELVFKRQTPPISGEGGVMVSLPFEAYVDDSSEGAVAQITLKSTQLAI